MKTITPTKPRPRAPKKSIPAPQYTQNDIKEAIRLYFLSEPGKIAIKHLWSDEHLHTFRVNWWGPGETGIITSKFIRVKAEPEKEIQINIKRTETFKKE